MRQLLIPAAAAAKPAEPAAAAAAEGASHEVLKVDPATALLLELEELGQRQLDGAAEEEEQERPHGILSAPGLRANATRGALQSVTW